MKSVVVFKFMVELLLTLQLSKVTKGSSSASNVNDCYTFHDIESTWNEARDACRDMGAHLVTLETTDEYNKVKALLKEKVKETDSFYHYFVGLTRKDNTWKWTEGESPDATVPEGDSRWQSFQPSFNRDKRPEYCGEIWYPPTGLKGLNDIRCTYRNVAGRDRSRGYICENY